MLTLLALPGRAVRGALLAAGCATVLGLALPTHDLSAQNTSLVIGNAADAFPAGPFGNASGGQASVAMGQTFMQPTGGCGLGGCYLQSFSFWLSATQGSTVNPADLRFQAYVAYWDDVNGRATNVQYFSSVMSGPSGPSQQYTFNTPNLAIAAGQKFVAFLSVAGLSNLMPGTATADMELVDGSQHPYADGGWVYTNGGSSISDLTSNSWDYTGDPSLQARFEAHFTSNVVPEPSSLALLAGGGIALLVLARRRRA